jgi:hypothetical protein
MAARTRREALKDLAENYVTAHPNEGPSRIASRSTLNLHLFVAKGYKLNRLLKIINKNTKV